MIARPPLAPIGPSSPLPTWRVAPIPPGRGSRFAQVRDYELVMLREDRGLSFRELGERLGVSQARAQQLYKRLAPPGPWDRRRLP